MTGPRAFSCSACAVALELEADGVFAAPGETEVSFPDDSDALLVALEDSSFWFRHRQAVIGAFLERFPVAGPLWDVGGGSGFHALSFQREGHAVVLVEPGAVRARNAARRGVRTVVRGTLEGVGLPAASLAGISLFDVIEHLADPSPLLAECRRVLAPGGRLLVTVPAWRALWSQTDDYAQHHHRYTLPGLQARLRKSGFHIDDSAYFFQALVLPIAAFRALPYHLSRWTRSAAPAISAVEHAPGGLSQRLVERLLARELKALRAGGRPLFGASIIAVASPSAVEESS